VLDTRTSLHYCAAIEDPLAELFDVLIGTGLRKGEALGLHWADVDHHQRVLFVRYTLSNINNTTPVFTAPKTKTSRAWVGLSTRVVDALPSIARPYANTGNDSARPAGTRNSAWSSAAPTGNPYDPNTCYAASTTSPRRRDCPASGFTTYDTRPPP
jgi:integrase